MTPRALDRFWAKVSPEPNSGCWLWTGCVRNGYGNFYANRKTTRTHRIAYEHYVGEIPAGLVLDHKCRNTTCCNPDHLEAVSQAENVRRGNKHIQIHRLECRQGHRYTRRDKSGVPRCNICAAEYRARYREKQRNVNAGGQHVGR